jgi:hypothetical protein
VTTPQMLQLGFRVVGKTTNRRRLIDAGAALAAYTALDPRAEPHREAYLSAFWFADDFRRHLDETGSSKGYDGVCWTPFLWFDIDSPDDPECALRDARGLAAFLLQRYPDPLDEDDLLVFFSGSKGYHLGLPTFWSPKPSIACNRVARRFAEVIAAAARVTIDSGVYDKVRLFRAPNSKHPKTGLHKRRLTFAELLNLDGERHRELAKEPQPFDLPTITRTCDQAAADWQAALQAAEKESEAKTQRRAVADGTPRLNRTTLDYIRDAAEQGDRHRLLFSAAANLAEFNCPPALAHALLTETGLDSGLPPAEVRRQIDCGLSHVAKVGTAPLAVGPPSPASSGTDAMRAALANLWARQSPPAMPVAEPTYPQPTPLASDGPYGREGDRR